MDFYSLANAEELSGVEDLTIPRARSIVHVVLRHRDYSIVQLLKSTTDHRISFDIIVVDVETDAVLSKNRHDIQYRERLAFYVPADPKRLVEVYALRKGFPKI